jgi:hypothetical protein
MHLPSMLLLLYIPATFSSFIFLFPYQLLMQRFVCFLCCCPFKGLCKVTSVPCFSWFYFQLAVHRIVTPSVVSVWLSLLWTSWSLSTLSETPYQPLFSVCTSLQFFHPPFLTDLRAFISWSQAPIFISTFCIWTFSLCSLLFYPEDGNKMFFQNNIWTQKTVIFINYACLRMEL